MFIHVHIPALEAQVERLCRPRLSRRRVVVESAAATVISAWPQMPGIEYGLSSWEARLRYPEAAFFPADEQKYLFFWERACEIAAHYSPDLREEPRHRICLDMAGMEMLFGLAKQAAERMVQQIAQAGLIARAGIGQSRIMARLAADITDGGIGEIAADELGALPIDILPDLNQRIHRALHDLGLSTFADVQAVPAHMLKAAFGEAGERLSRAVRGVDFSTPERSIPEETARLAPAVDDVAALRGVLMSLAESLGRRLRKSGLVAREVRLRIGFRTSREQSFNISALAANEVKAARLLENATASDEDLFRAALPALMRPFPSGPRGPLRIPRGRDTLIPINRENGRIRRPVRLLALGASIVFREQAAGQLYFSRFTCSRSPLVRQLADGVAACGLATSGCANRGLKPAATLDHALDKIKDRYGEQALRRASTTTRHIM